MPYGVYIDKIEDDEREVFIYGCLIGDGQRTAGSFVIKGDDLDSDENHDFVKDIEEIRDGGTNENLEPSKERKLVVLDRRKIRDLPLEGPQYDNWIEYVKQGGNCTTSDVIQVLEP